MKTTPQPSRYCLKCHYPLHALPEPRCPECGREFDPNDPSTYHIKGITRWHNLRNLFIHPLFYLGPIWLAFIFLPELAWPLLFLSLAAGLFYILKGRWSGLILILLNPGSLQITFAIVGYATGTGHHDFVGSGKPELYNVHKTTRLPWVHHYNPFPFNNDTLTLLGKLFGPAHDTYASHYPTREEALDAIKDATPFDITRFYWHNRITINNARYSFWANVNRNAFANKIYAPLLHNTQKENIEEIIKRVGMPTAKLYNPDCIIMKIPSAFQYIEEPELASKDDFFLLLIESRKGRVFAGYYFGEAWRPRGWWPEIIPRQRQVINTTILLLEILFIAMLCLYTNKRTAQSDNPLP